LTADELLGSLEAVPGERLRWRVLSRFGILPGSKRSREISDGDILLCAAHMVLDSRPSGARARVEAAQSLSFDEERFRALSGGIDEA
jgi:hypothetical protein